MTVCAASPADQALTQLLLQNEIQMAGGFAGMCILLRRVLAGHGGLGQWI